MTRPADALPVTDEIALLIRTDFDDDAAWQAIQDAVAAPVEPDDDPWEVVAVDDPAHRGRSSDELCALHPVGEGVLDYFFVADRTAMTAAHHPLLVVPVPHPEPDPDPEPRPGFRVVPEEVRTVDGNLMLANMDWEDFSDDTDEDGVFHGF